MKNIILSLVLMFLFAGMSFAQGCGPNCPVCSGAGTNPGALLSQNSLLISALGIPDAEEETTVINASYGIFDWLDAGVGYAAKTEKIRWNVRIQPIVEKGLRPGLILGTGSVQTDGTDQSVYAQFIKSIEIPKVMTIGFSAGAAMLAPDFERTYGIAGITASFFDKYGAFVNYDGESYHEGISWNPLDLVTLSFLMVESEFPAFSVGFRF